MRNTLNRLSKELNLPTEVIIKAYKAYWRFIRETIEVLPLKEELDEEAFSKLKTNFNIPNLGKLHCTYSRYRGVKLKEQRRKDNDKHKKG